MSQGSLNPKIRFLGQKVWPVARSRTDRQTDTQTDRVTTEGTLSGFQDFFLQPIIKDRPNNKKSQFSNGKRSYQPKYNILKRKIVTGSLITKMYKCHKGENRKISIKKRNDENISKRTCLISRVTKFRFLGQTMWPVARAHTHIKTNRHTVAQTHRVTTVGTRSGSKDCFLPPIIKDRPNIGILTHNAQHSQGIWIGQNK